VGGEDEDVIFGRITDLAMHPDGTFYVLDNQLAHVVVISSEGEYLGEISREGDGPGELRQPMGLVLLTDDLLGIGSGFPAKLTTLKPNGSYVDTHYMGPDTPWARRPVGRDPGNLGRLLPCR
jgi:hypothetical protein